MVIPLWAWKLAGGGVALLMLFSAYQWQASHHYKRGVTACEAAQEARNEEVEPIAQDLNNETDKADEQLAQKTETIRTETRTGISAIHLERARKDAENTGKELGRLKTIEEIRANGGCLTIPYSPNDKLFLDAQGQQRDIFGAVIRGDEADQADTVRQPPER